MAHRLARLMSYRPGWYNLCPDCGHWHVRVR